MTFNRMFKQIGTPYKTKESYLKAKDKFKGKYYCYYVDSRDFNKIYYFRNHELVDRCLGQLCDEHSESKDSSNLEENSNSTNSGLKT